MRSEMTIFLCALGLVLVGFSAWIRYMQQKASSWPFVNGQIVESELRHTIDETSAHIAYEYSVTGRRHKSSQVSYSGMSKASSEREALISRYPVGAEVTVYYDPTNPSQAVLENKQSNTWHIPLAIGLVVLAGGLLTVVVNG